MKLLLACASAFALAACSATTMGGDGPAEMAADATPSDALGYVSMAGSSDLYEIESSRLALQRGSSAGVRQFAQMMIDHHTMTTQQVMQAARAAGMSPPPPTLLPPHRALLDELQPANGSDFDRMYLRQQRMAHRMALALHQNYARSGDTAQLRQTAATAVPIIQRHIDALKGLSPT